MSATRLTKSGNDAEVSQTFASQVSSSFESDTHFIGNNIQLSTSIGLLYYNFLSITPLRLWGSVGDKQNCCGMFTYLHKLSSH